MVCLAKLTDWQQGGTISLALESYKIYLFVLWLTLYLSSTLDNADCQCNKWRFMTRTTPWTHPISTHKILVHTFSVHFPFDSVSHPPPNPLFPFPSFFCLHTGTWRVYTPTVPICLPTSILHTPPSNCPQTWFIFPHPSLFFPSPPHPSPLDPYPFNPRPSVPASLIPPSGPLIHPSSSSWLASITRNKLF